MAWGLQSQVAEAHAQCTHLTAILDPAGVRVFGVVGGAVGALANPDAVRLSALVGEAAAPVVCSQGGHRSVLRLALVVQRKYGHIYVSKIEAGQGVLGTAWQIKWGYWLGGRLPGSEG